MGNLFDAAAMYDEDYLHFSPRLMTAASWPRTGPLLLALIFRVRLPITWMPDWLGAARASEG
jgi:hypothetical protein